MPCFLWDLKLEEIECGWQSIYEEALQDCPKGKFIAYKESYDDLNKIQFNNFDPVSYKTLILQKYNGLKEKAIHLMNNKDNLETKRFINELFNIDVLLYTLLMDWVTDEKDLDFSSFNPQYIENIKPDYGCYFENEENPYPEIMSYYNKFKLVNSL